MRIAFGIVLLAGALAQAGVIDDFNRPDAPTLGSNWTMQNGGAEIIGNMARSGGGGQNTVLATYNGVTANGAFVDVYNMDTSLSYLALVLGYADINNNYFIKVQNQSSGDSFGNAAFYYGNNGSGGSGSFFTLGAPFSSGRLTAFMSGTLATLWIDSNFDGTAEQTYTHDYGVDTGGAGIGLGLYGTGRVDNFGTGEFVAAIPEPGTLALLACGLGLIGLRARRRSS